MGRRFHFKNQSRIVERAALWVVEPLEGRLFLSGTITTPQLSQTTPTSPTSVAAANSDFSPEIISAGSASFFVGQTASFVVNATANPTPQFGEIGTLPNGITFTDNGDGSATFSGTPMAGTAGDYHLTLIAENGLGLDANQSFHLIVMPAFDGFSSPRQLYFANSFQTNQGYMRTAVGDLNGDGIPDLGAFEYGVL